MPHCGKYAESILWTLGEKIECTNIWNTVNVLCPWSVLALGCPSADNLASATKQEYLYDWKDFSHLNY